MKGTGKKSFFDAAQVSENSLIVDLQTKIETTSHKALIRCIATWICEVISSTKQT